MKQKVYKLKCFTIFILKYLHTEIQPKHLTIFNLNSVLIKIKLKVCKYTTFEMNYIATLQICNIIKN